MSERFIKIGFADWQAYPLLLALFLPFFTFFGFNPIGYAFIGACLMGTWLRFGENYYDWRIAKLKAKRRKEAKGK